MYSIISSTCAQKPIEASLPVLKQGFSRMPSNMRQNTALYEFLRKLLPKLPSIKLTELSCHLITEIKKISLYTKTGYNPLTKEDVEQKYSTIYEASIQKILIESGDSQQMFLQKLKPKFTLFPRKRFANI